MSLLAVGSIIEAVGKVAGDLITTDKEKMEMEIEQRKLDLEEKRIDQATDLAQIEVNKIEAGQTNVFVSGWRPFVGWTCGIALCYHFVLQPFLMFVFFAIGKPMGLPVFDMSTLTTVLFGMLGLGGMRSFEKTKKSA